MTNGISLGSLALIMKWRCGLRRQADLMRVGEAALTDTSAREQLVHRVTDAALEFLLSVLPNLPVPPIEGVRDGVAYNISELDLTGTRPSVLRAMKISCESQREGLARGDRKRPLNDGQIPNVRGVRVHVSTGYNRVEGSRRASRTGLVSPSPTRTP